MNQFKNIVASMWILFILSGCLYGQCMNGPCALERERLIRNTKPYGAHWIKEGMTKEQRREDSWACGATRTVLAADHVIFSSEQRESVRTAGEEGSFGPDGRLLDQWRSCMASRGYVFLKECDARCMYP